MRVLSTIQKREKLNSVYAVDEKGCGGANHHYKVVYSTIDFDDRIEKTAADIQFQCGPRKEFDSVHGVLDTDLLEIVRDRLKGFQSGEFATEYNAKALEYIELALMYLNRRVEDRIERCVIGTNNK